ncbi:MAG: hypothetical protein ACOZBZ_04430 [Patescibacteria group bacterium]
MVRKYDWLKLQQEFITGGWLTVSDFFRSKGVPSNSRTRANAKGWREKKVAYGKRVIAEVREKTIESEAEIRLRQQRAAKYLQYKGLKKLEELPVEKLDTKEARKLLVDGLQQEREALGLDKDIKATQINISYPSRTELDKFIETATYEQILELIAEVKKEKARRKSTLACESLRNKL